MLRHHDRNLASLSQNIPNNLGNPGFFTKIPHSCRVSIMFVRISSFAFTRSCFPIEQALPGACRGGGKTLSYQLGNIKYYLHQYMYIGCGPHTVSVESEGLQGFATKHVIILVLVVTVTRRWPTPTVSSYICLRISVFIRTVPQNAYYFVFLHR